MAGDEILYQPVRTLAARIRARKLSPVEVTRACLDRIAAGNPSVHAFLTVTAEQAMAAARAAEQEIRRGRYRGPLHGIPYAPKDLIATKGIRTTNGSKVTAEWTPDFDATVTARLQAAGAILVGKLNLLEFAMGSGQRGLNGPARNPWSLAHSPSGSSSGSGAALAAGMVPLTIGTDSGGSIRSPAKSCGVTGLKPTYGRISRHGVTTLSWTLDHVGPMGRSAACVAEMLQVMAGEDALDPACSAVAVPDYRKALRGGVKGLRIGVPKGHFFQHVHAETDAALRRALAALRELGAVEVEASLPKAAMYSTVSAVILGSESAAFHETRLKKHGGMFDPLVRERLEAGGSYSAVDYIKAMRVRTLLIEEVRRVFESCDVLMLPAGNAPPELEGEIEGTDLPRDPPLPPRPDVFNLANVTGIPAIVFPCGFTSGTPALPLGIQFCARPFEEGVLLRLAHAYQAVTDWHTRAPNAANGPFL